MKMLDYDIEIQKAENILNEASLAYSREDFNDIKLYYDLYDELRETKLSHDDKEIYLLRLYDIFGQFLK